MAGGVRVLHLEIVDNIRQHRPEKHKKLESQLVTCVRVFLTGKHEKKKAKKKKKESAGVLPGQQEGCSHSYPGSKGDDVSDNQVTL